jgi:uncharacterized protein YndB with AHSA1/START domain
VNAVDRENVCATVVVAAPATRVFALLADPRTHAAIDGTGWVQDAADQAPLTEVGQIFRMDMYHPNHPNGDYRVANQVQVLDPPRAIAWRTGQEKDDGQLEFGGWVWRYDLVPLGPSDTEVTLIYDCTFSSRRSVPSTSPTHCITWQSLRHPLPTPRHLPVAP